MAGKRALQGHIVATGILCFGLAAAVAQEAGPSSGYVPSIGDMMIDIQLRHSKLWYAGQSQNWELAQYELRQLETSFERVTRFYPDVPASALTRANELAKLIGNAVEAKDAAVFETSFDQMTTECNACHQASDRAFIVIRRPAFPSPFSNQVFGPQQ